MRADVLDALSSNRSYRGPMSLDDAVAEISRDSGKQFDPEIVSVATGKPFLHDLRNTQTDHPSIHNDRSL